LINILIDLNNSAARFHEYLSESLLKLGFKNPKHDPESWMMDNTSDYEYLAMHVDDILIWKKEPIVIIKSLENTHMLRV
jgi:hypothetical protein